MKKKHYLGFDRKCGILMPISSLPSKYGIGSFGSSAYDFVDFLSNTHQKCWQVLPLNPTSYGDSPYQSPSSYALNPYFIDLPTLRKKKLLTNTELAASRIKTKKVDYGTLFSTRYDTLRLAYSRFTPDRAFKAFCKKNASWLDDYAFFMSLKVTFGYKSLGDWDDEYKIYDRAMAHIDEYAEEMGFWRFIQYELFLQWSSLLSYAHSKGICLIGDMPIYVAHDSVEVWSHPEQFLLTEDLVPVCVAGCPPDMFSEDGQLWGNPIYDWDRMKSDGFGWWVERIKRSFELYDILRIDHFRGFSSYYSIPYGDDTARGGHWETAPGQELFDTLAQRLGSLKIIAEDLGFITEDVTELLTHTGYAGMKLLQFAFSCDNSVYLPRCFADENCIVYTGSHDSDCTRSWANSLSGDELQRFRSECPHTTGQSRTYDLIELAYRSIATLAVIPMQDILELKNEDGRMNYPSSSFGNWTWMASPRYATKSLTEKLMKLTDETKRGYVRR